jgi:hypothetical protein
LAQSPSPYDTGKCIDDDDDAHDDSYIIIQSDFMFSMDGLYGGGSWSTYWQWLLFPMIMVVLCYRILSQVMVHSHKFACSTDIQVHDTIVQHVNTHSRLIGYMGQHAIRIPMQYTIG